MGCRQTKVVPVAESVARKKISQRLLSSDRCEQNSSGSAGSRKVEMPRTVLASLNGAEAPSFTPICWGVEQLPLRVDETNTCMEVVTCIASLPRPLGARGRRRVHPIECEEKVTHRSDLRSAPLKRPTAAVYSRRPSRVLYTRYAEEWMTARDSRTNPSSSHADTCCQTPRTVWIHEANEITVRPLAARSRRGAWYETSATPSARQQRYN